MAQGNKQDALRNAVEHFSEPFKSMEDVRLVSMKLDAIAAILLVSAYVQQKLGHARATELATASPELPNLLREVDETLFAEVATAASDLLELSRSSVVEFGDEDDEVMMANTARQQFHEAFSNLLLTVAF